MKQKMQKKIEDYVFAIQDHPDLLKPFAFPNYMLRKEGMFTCGSCGHVYGKAYIQLIANNRCVCRHCGAEAEVKQISSRTNWDNLVTESRAQTVQVHEGRIVFRQYAVVQRVDYDLRQRVSAEEIERIIIHNKSYVECYRHETWKGGLVWSFGHVLENDRKRRPKQVIFLKPEKWSELLKDTEVRYTGIGAWMDDNDEHWYYSAQRYIMMAARYNWIELLKKSGMNRLYEDIVRYNADLRYCRPTVIRRYRKQIMDKNRGAHWVAKRRYADTHKLDVADDTLDLVDMPSLRMIEKDFKQHADKLIRYLKPIETCNSSMSVHFYSDYTDMMAKIGTPLDESTRYPKDLKKAHDDAVSKFNAMKSEIENKEYSKHYQALKRLEWSKNRLMIVAPVEVQEILNEGKALHHCVGSYVDKVIKGETAILFIRNINDPETPFYTLEYRKGQIIQCRGNRNDETTNEIDEFTTAWIAWTRRKTKRTTSAQVMIPAAA